MLILTEWLEKQLVPKKITETVHRGGKTFERTRTIMVRPEEEIPPEVKKKIDELMGEFSGRGPESVYDIPKEYLQHLSRAKTDLVRYKAVQRVEKKYLSLFENDDNTDVQRVIMERSPEIALKLVGQNEAAINFIYPWDYDKARKMIEGSRKFSEYQKKQLVENLGKRESGLKEYDMDAKSIKEFVKTGKLNLSIKMKSMVYKALLEGIASDSFQEFVEDYLYYGEERIIHHSIRYAWVNSSNKDYSLVLKFTAKEIFNTDEIMHHDNVKMYDKKVKEIFHREGYTYDDVVNYVKKQYGLTQQFLEESYAEDKEVKVYRGTTSRELSDIKAGENVLMNQNPISSWSKDEATAKSFARRKRREGKDGYVLRMGIPRRDIFSTFLTHGVGHEGEMMIIGKIGRMANVTSEYKS